MPKKDTKKQTIQNAKERYKETNYTKCQRKIQRNKLYKMPKTQNTQNANAKEMPKTQNTQNANAKEMPKPQTTQNTKFVLCNLL